MSSKDAMAKSVIQLLKRRGQEITFRRVSEGVYNTATGATGAATTSDELALVAFVGYNIRYIDGVNILRGDRKALMGALKSDGTPLVKVPLAGDMLIGQDDDVSIVDVRIIRDADTNTAYICQVRE